MAVRARNADFACFKRLPQTIEHSALKFGQFVQKQHAQMRKAYFARPNAQPATDQRRHGCAVVRRSKWPCAHQPATLQGPCNRCNHRHFQRFSGRQFGQYARHARRQKRLSRTRRTHHAQIVTTGSRDLKRALGCFLPLHHFHVGTAFARFGDSGFGGAQQRLPLQMIQQRKQIRRSDNLYLARPRRFGPLRRRTYQPHAA